MQDNVSHLVISISVETKLPF